MFLNFFWLGYIYNTYAPMWTLDQGDIKLIYLQQIFNSTCGYNQNC
jgi:hypothetical protein